jgi:glycerol-3-phosphate acyltransferase PlsY
VITLDTLPWTLLLAALAGGYLLGSIPFGLILTRYAGLGDVRAIGSGNIGATNVLRTGRKGLAAATLLGDALKGTLAVLLAGRFGLEAALVAGLGAFLGHLFPVWLGFKGGKGVATFLGVLLALSPLGLLAFAAIWLGLAFTLKYSSLAALAASGLTPLVLWALGQPAVAGLFLLLAILLWWKHAPNIRRLIDGTEGRIGQKG